MSRFYRSTFVGFSLMMLAQAALALALEEQLHLHPHASDPAVREIRIQEPGREALSGSLGVPEIPGRLGGDLCELGMIENIESLPAKLQSSLFSHGEGFEKAQVHVVHPAGEKRVTTDSRGIGQSSAFDPVNICRRHALRDVQFR